MNEENEKSTKQYNLDDLFQTKTNNIATIIRKPSPEKSKFPIEKQKDKEKTNLNLLETEQNFKVEDLERWIEENKRVREEKRWNAYREQKIKQLNKQSLENEVQWVKKNCLKNEKWDRYQKTVDEIERRDNDRRQRENIKKLEDERRWAVYSKQLTEKMKMEEAKVKARAENKALEDKRWEEYMKRMMNRKESEKKWTEDNRKAVDEVFAEFDELVQSEHADVVLSESHCHCPISKRYVKEYLKADRSAQEERWKDYRKMLEGVIREKYMTNVKNSLKTEDFMVMEDKYSVESGKMAVHRDKKDKTARRICKDVQDQVFADFHELIEGKEVKALTKEGENSHYQDLQRKIEEQLKFETKKQGEDRKPRTRVVEPLDDRKWAEYRKQLIDKFDREEAEALKAEAERSADEERRWAEMKEIYEQTEKEENARAGIEQVLAEYEELADSMDKK